ncbi:MAG TPA: NAD-dependent deacylase [Vicinamibacterales bacterium]|nr:NAD-dependent deacylase [Vicinamibacterales bacterium]
MIETLVDRLHSDARITVLTGAGVSAASGVPTFRGADGLWKNFRPETLATAEAFGRDPKLVWEWYAWRRFRIAACDPNAAHRVLADWSRRFKNFRLITQNVDGLHERAFAKATAQQAGPSDVIRLHGSIWDVRCWQGCAKSPNSWRDETISFAELPPRCPHCKGPIRPGVVWFGETLDPVVVEQASIAAHCDVFITIGTSAVVYPAAGFIATAKHHGAFTVEINPETTPATAAVDLSLRGGAEMILPLIDQQLVGV